MKNELKIILATALFGIAFVAVPASAGNEGPNSYFEWGEQSIGQSFNKVTFQSNITDSRNNLDEPIAYGALYESIAGPQYNNDSGLTFQKASLIERTQEDFDNAVVGDPFYYEQTK